MTRRRPPAAGVLAVVVALVAVGVPVAAVALRAVHPDGALGLEAVERVLSSRRTWRLVAVTVAQAAASCAATLAVGVPVAWVLSRFHFPGRRFVTVAATVPFVLPSVVVGAAFASLLGPRGLVDARGTWWAILAAHLCFNLAVVVRTVSAALRGVGDDVEASARMLGATPFGAARRLVLPSIAPAVASAAVIVFLFCLTSFGVVVILGGGPVSTVEVEIWTRATRQFDLSGAGVLAILQVAAVLATLAVHARVSRSAARSLRSTSGSPSRRPRTAAEVVAVLCAVGAVALVSVVPLAALAERSLRVGDALGLAHWRGLGSAVAGTALAVSPAAAVRGSITTALTATALALVVALPASRLVALRPGGVADRVLLLPLGVSATTIGLGVLLAVGRPPVDLRRSWWLVPLGQALVSLPLVVRSILPALRAVPASLPESAALLGASPSQRWWRVEVPLLRRALVAGVGLGLVSCLGEFGATVFLSRSDRVTVPVAIERLLSRPGGAGFGQAMALSCVLVVLCGLVLLVVDRVAGERDGPGPTF